MGVTSIGDEDWFNFQMILSGLKGDILNWTNLALKVKCDLSGTAVLSGIRKPYSW